MVESLGVEFPDYFQGYGSSRFDFCTYGIGSTEEEALDDCMDTMASSAGFDFTADVEQRIRAAYGDCDGDTTVADLYDGADGDGDDDCAECAYFHVGIKWNEKSV